MDYESYGYHSSKHLTTPRKGKYNIKGLELEISDYDSGYLLDELVDEGILTVPETEDEKKDLTIVVEDDGSVYKELIFKASCNQTLLKGVKLLSEKLHGNIDNSHGTSCHIHINNGYIRELNLTRYDVVKATEFLAPVLYRISGRDESSMYDWTKSALNRYISITDDDLYRRAKFVENNLNTDNGRYYIVNTEPMNTTEIRIFSNYYDFNYKYIKMYLETVDFILELAYNMKNKDYVNDFNLAISLSKNFFEKRKYKAIFNKHNLDVFFLDAKERKIKSLNEELRYIRRRINSIRINNNDNNRQNAIETLRALRSINNNYGVSNIEFNINEINLNEIENVLTESINNRLESVRNNEE